MSDSSPFEPSQVQTQPTLLGCLRKPVHISGVLVLYAICVVSLMGYGGLYNSWLDLTSHFRPYYAVCLLIGTLYLAGTRRWRQLLPVLGCFALGAWSILPWYLTPAGPVDRTGNLRVLLANVLTSNTHHDRLLELIEREQPDVLVLLETDTNWIASLEPLEASYPFHLAVPRSDNFGIAIYSRLPMSDLRVVTPGQDLPSIIGTLTVGNQAVELIGTHPIPPIRGRRFRMRNEQLADLANLVSGPTILAGDLNLTMWSPHHARFESESGLRNTRRGFGILPSWPTGEIPVKIPLDHCLVSDDILVRDTRLGPSIGSDHLPLIVDLVIR